MPTMKAKHRIPPPLKWHGGKFYLAQKIIKLMPSHTHYCEHYAGGLSVLLAKDPEGVSEVVNDVDSGLTGFWRVLQDEKLFAGFARRMEAVPFSQAEWCQARNMDGKGQSVHTACAFFTLCRQSLAGRMKSFAPLSKTRTRGGMNEQASAWMTAVDGLPMVHERLRRVAILNMDGRLSMMQEDGPETLHYLDPPYLDETRASKDVYAHEMSRDQHSDLLNTAVKMKGKVMISGYRSQLYDVTLRFWKRHDFELPNNAAGGKTKRKMIECLWCNF